MLTVGQLLAEYDRRSLGLLAGGACLAGAVAAVLLSRFHGQRHARARIQRARDRRTESLRRAEEAVLRYEQSVRTWRDRNMNCAGLCVIGQLAVVD